MRLCGISEQRERDEANQTSLDRSQSKNICSIDSEVDEQIKYIGKLSQLRLKRFSEKLVNWPWQEHKKAAQIKDNKPFLEYYLW